MLILPFPLEYFIQQVVSISLSTLSQKIATFVYPIDRNKARVSASPPVYGQLR
jgi:hypothetical protein